MAQWLFLCVCGVHPKGFALFLVACLHDHLRSWIQELQNKWNKKAKKFENTGMTKKYLDRAGNQKVSAA